VFTNRLLSNSKSLAQRLRSIEEQLCSDSGAITERLQSNFKPRAQRLRSVCRAIV
jgi:hypothetical protein